MNTPFVSNKLLQLFLNTQESSIRTHCCTPNEQSAFSLPIIINAGKHSIQVFFKCTYIFSFIFICSNTLVCVYTLRFLHEQSQYAIFSSRHSKTNHVLSSHFLTWLPPSPLSRYPGEYEDENGYFNFLKSELIFKNIEIKFLNSVTRFRRKTFYNFFWFSN